MRLSCSLYGVASAAALSNEPPITRISPAMCSPHRLFNRFLFLILSPISRSKTWQMSPSSDPSRRHASSPGCSRRTCNVGATYRSMKASTSLGEASSGSFPRCWSSAPYHRRRSRNNADSSLFRCELCVPAMMTFALKHARLGGQLPSWVWSLLSIVFRTPITKSVRTTLSASAGNIRW